MFLPREKTEKTGGEVHTRTESTPDASETVGSSPRIIELFTPVGAAALRGPARGASVIHDLPEQDPAPSRAPSKRLARDRTIAATITIIFRNVLTGAVRIQRIAQHLFTRFPVLTLVVTAGIIYAILLEDFAVREEQLKQRIAELEETVQASHLEHPSEPVSLTREASPGGDSQHETETNAPELAGASESRSNAAMLSETTVPGAPPANENLPIVSAQALLDGSERDDPYVGAPGAPLLVMFFSDLQCKRCGDFYLSVIAPLLAEYRQSDRVRIIFRDFPLPSNQFAEQAANFAHCAGEQGAYFPAVEALVRHQREVASGDIKVAARDLTSLHPDKLLRCMRALKYQPEIARDRENALRIGATGVPSTFIGIRGEDGQFRGKLVRGAQPKSVIEQTLDSTRARVLPVRADSRE